MRPSRKLLLEQDSVRIKFKQFVLSKVDEIDMKMNKIGARRIAAGKPETYLNLGRLLSALNEPDQSFIRLPKPKPEPAFNPLKYLTYMINAALPKPKPQPQPPIRTEPMSAREKMIEMYNCFRLDTGSQTLYKLHQEILRKEREQTIMKKKIIAGVLKRLLVTKEYMTSPIWAALVQQLVNQSKQKIVSPTLAAYFKKLDYSKMIAALNSIECCRGAWIKWDRRLLGTNVGTVKKEYVIQNISHI